MNVRLTVLSWAASLVSCASVPARPINVTVHDIVQSLAAFVDKRTRIVGRLEIGEHFEMA